MSPTPQQRALIRHRHATRVARAAERLGTDSDRIDPEAPAVKPRTTIEALTQFNIACGRLGDELAAAAANDLARIGRALKRRA